VLFEKTVDRGMQVGDGADNAAFEPALGEGCEEALTALSQEADVGVERPSRAAFEPSVNIGMFVSGAGVDDAVDRLFPRNLFFNDIEEVDT
jgi:hypothetical protein